MPTTSEWVNDDHTIMHIKVVGAWIFEEVWAAYVDVLDQIRALDHPVHVIIDHTQETEKPPSLGAMLPKFGELPYPPNMGLIIQVAADQVLRTGHQLYSMMYRKVHDVEVIEDAFAMIKAYEVRRAVSKEE